MGTERGRKRERLRMADLDPAMLEKFRQLQIIMAESPELIEAMKSPELLALATKLQAEKQQLQQQQQQQQQQQHQKYAEPEPQQNNYPTIGFGHSDDVSVISEMTTPTVMTSRDVSEDEFYPEIDLKGSSSSGVGGPRRTIHTTCSGDDVPPMHQIGVGSSTGGGEGMMKTKNKISQVRPAAARRAIARYNNNSKNKPLPAPMMKIKELDDGSSTASSSGTDLRADLKKRPEKLKKSYSGDLNDFRPYMNKPSSSSAPNNYNNNNNNVKRRISSSRRNRSGTNGRGVKVSKSMPTATSNHSRGSSSSNTSSSNNTNNNDENERKSSEKVMPSSTTTTTTTTIPRMKLVPVTKDRKNVEPSTSSAFKTTANTSRSTPQLCKTSHGKNTKTNYDNDKQQSQRSTSYTNNNYNNTSNTAKQKAKQMGSPKRSSPPTPNTCSNNNNNTIPRESSATTTRTVKEANITNFSSGEIFAAKTILSSSADDRQGTTSRPDDYLPGTDPFTNSRKKKDVSSAAKKKKTYGNSDNISGTTRVDGWLGSGRTTTKRTWRVKEKQPSSS